MVDRHLGRFQFWPLRIVLLGTSQVWLWVNMDTFQLGLVVGVNCRVVAFVWKSPVTF